MTDTDTKKYQCGCGKSYISYPAYSTHKRLKHQNQSIRGTQLPHQYIPKRGRPSFALPNHQIMTDNPFSALTIIELALLKMEQTYGKVLSQPQCQADMDVLDIYQECDKLAICQTGEALIFSIRNFNQIVVNHTNVVVGVYTSTFLQELTHFILQDLKTKSSSEQIPQNNKINPTIFNEFFATKKLRERSVQLAKLANKPFKLMLDITVALSQYLYKVNLLTSKLSAKQ